MIPPELDFIFESEPIPETEPLLELAKIVWAGEEVTDAYEISVLFCDSEQMREFNRLYRGKDAATDVLSFAHEALHEQGEKAQKLFVCDIIIDTNYVFKQNGSDGFQKEIEVVFTHALLHLLGYDHIKNKDREIMENKEHTYNATKRGVTQSG